MGIALNAPSLFERSRIHGVEAKLVQKSSDYGLGVRISTCDDERAPILGARAYFKRINAANAST